MIVKICGLTREDDVRCAVETGADMTGFIFAESPRKVSLERARELTALVPEEISKVGVFVDADIDTVKKAVEECGLDHVQLHGNESPEYCSQFGNKAIKVFRITDEKDLEKMKEYNCSLFLLDTFDPVKKGGTGRTFDRDTARRAKTFGHIIVAGGLTVDNVNEIVKEVNPYGVDVSSGIEKKPGVKDHVLMKRFIQLAKEAYDDLS